MLSREWFELVIKRIHWDEHGTADRAHRSNEFDARQMQPVQEAARLAGTSRPLISLGSVWTQAAEQPPQEGRADWSLHKGAMIGAPKSPLHASSSYRQRCQNTLSSPTVPSMNIKGNPRPSSVGIVCRPAYASPASRRAQRSGSHLEN